MEVSIDAVVLSSNGDIGVPPTRKAWPSREKALMAANAMDNRS